MDTRDGTIYPDLAAALGAGVPEDRLVTGTRAALEELRPRVRFTKGSFKTAPSVAAQLRAFETRVGDVSLQALRAGGDRLLIQVTEALGVASRLLALVRDGELQLTDAVVADIEASFARAERTSTTMTVPMPAVLLTHRS